MSRSALQSLSGRLRALGAPAPAALLWAALTLVLLALPGPEVERRAAYLGVLMEVGGDKVVHALLFGVQAALAWRWTRMARFRAPGAVALGATLLFGAGTEALQHVLPVRSAELWDLVADGVGAVVGLVLARWIGSPGASRDW